MTSEIDYTLKLLIVGNTNVGKTTYFNIIQNNKAYFAGSTIGVDFTKLYYTINDKYVKVIVWDTAGQERYNAIVRNYFRDTCGIILMFDVSDPDTCNTLEDLLQMLIYDNKCSHEHPILLLGNKSDLQNKMNIDEIDRLIQEYNIIYKEISCKKDSQNHLEEIFTSFIGKIINGSNVENCYGIKRPGDKSQYITLNEKYKETSKSKKCCNIV